MTSELAVRRRAARALRVYGADPARWPGGVDGSLWAAACAEPRLRRLLDAAQRLDAALEESAARPSEDFLARLTASAPALGQTRRTAGATRSVVGDEGGGIWRALFPSAPAWAPAMALAFALFAGGVTGLLTVRGEAAALDEDEAALVAALSELSFVDGGDGWPGIRE